MAAPSIIGPHKCFGNILEVKFAQLCYFLSQSIVVTKDIVAPCPNVRGTCHMRVGVMSIAKFISAEWYHGFHPAKQLCHLSYFVKLKQLKQKLGLHSGFN